MKPTSSRFRPVISWITGFVKTACVIAILGWLFWQATHGNTFPQLLATPKHWGILSLAVVAIFVAISLTIVRWMFLVRAVGISLSFADAWRYGMIGFLFNLSPMGIAGGDLIRVYFLKQERHYSGAKTLASVMIDRLIGLYVMFVFAMIFVGITGFWQQNSNIAVLATQVAVFCFSVATVGIAMGFILTSDRNQSRLESLLQRLPKIGKPLQKIMLAISVYRHQYKALGLAVVLTFGVHFFFCLAIYFFALGLFRTAPPMVDHFVLHPIANITSIIPLPAGPYEAVLDKMYPLFPFADNLLADHQKSFPQSGYGLVVALAYRLGNLIVAGVGLTYYLFSASKIHLEE